MAFTTDNGGIALRADIKVSAGGSSWNTRLSQIAKTKGEIIICTYSLPRQDTYIPKILDKRSSGITLLVNARFAEQARRLKERYPELRIHLNPRTHAKMVLIEPHTVWLSSENFGSSGWFETTVGVHSPVAYHALRESVNPYITGTPFGEEAQYA